MTSPNWRNRIVGYDVVDPATLAANPANWRRHPDAQAAALAGVLDEVGYVQSVIVNRTTGRLVDGHLRAGLARESGAEEIPVVYVELSEDEERLILATLDPLGALATADTESLGALLATVETSDAALRALLDDLAPEPTIEPTAPDDFPEYDETISTEHTCPKCGYAWSGGT